jgi:hypothetical protein
MQPYFFPYIGYFQLIEAVDVFVIFDDVNYIKRGWVNKNRILQHGKITNITLPVQNASQNKKINQHFRTVDIKVLDKLKKQIKFSYAKALNFDLVNPLIEEIIDHPETNLAKYLTYSLKKTSQHLGIKTQFIYSSDLSNHDDWDNAEQRIIDITKQLGGSQYINLPGGKELYKEKYFNENGIELSFINREFEEYKQFNSQFFQGGLSIIDFLMNKNSKFFTNKLTI